MFFECCLPIFFQRLFAGGQFRFHFTYWCTRSALILTWQFYDHLSRLWILPLSRCEPPYRKIFWTNNAKWEDGHLSTGADINVRMECESYFGCIEGGREIPAVRITWSTRQFSWPESILHSQIVNDELELKAQWLIWPYICVAYTVEYLWLRKVYICSWRGRVFVAYIVVYLWHRMRYICGLESGAYVAKKVVNLRLT